MLYIYSQMHKYLSKQKGLIFPALTWRDLETLLAVGKAEVGSPEAASTSYHVRATFLQAKSQDQVRTQTYVTTVVCQVNWSGYQFTALYPNFLNRAED